MTTATTAIRTPTGRRILAPRPMARIRPALPPDRSSVSGRDRRGGRVLAFRLPVDELSRYAGLTALVMAVLGAAGILATVAYLAAWNVPAPMLRLDPLSAALRSEVVLGQLAMLGIVLFGLAAMERRLARRPWAGRIALGAAIATIVYLAIDALNGGFVGPAATLGGGVLLFVAHRRDWLSDRAIAILLVAISLGTAAQTGYEMGVGYRDGRQPRTMVSLTTLAPIGGLAGATIDDAAWRYDDLYLVFRDGEAVYVSRAGAGSDVWVVPAMRISAVELNGVDK